MVHVLCDKKHRILADTSRRLHLAIDQKGMPEELPKNDGTLVKIQSRNCPPDWGKGTVTRRKSQIVSRVSGFRYSRDWFLQDKNRIRGWVKVRNEFKITSKLLLSACFTIFSSVLIRLDSLHQEPLQEYTM